MEISEWDCLRIVLNGREKGEGGAWGEWRGGEEALYIEFYSVPHSLPGIVSRVHTRGGEENEKEDTLT